MPTAEIITIGTEILLGEIVDTNAPYLARKLRDIGVDIFRKTSVGDNARRIAQAIQEALQRADIVITTGGLGPTVDDPTREAVALAMGLELEYRPELWDQIQARFKRYGRQPTDNNKRQAFVPQGAVAVENRVGTAPSFIMESGSRCIFSLPGVPREMEYLLEKAVIPYLQERYQLHGTIKARVLHTAGLGESQIDELVGDLEKLSNPTVGLAAHAGQVDIRITAKAASEAEAETLIHEVEDTVYKLLGEWIYGTDADTLEEAALENLRTCGWTLAVVEAGLAGELIGRLASAPHPFVGGEVLPAGTTPESLMQVTSAARQSRAAQVGLGVLLVPGPERQEIFIALITPKSEQQVERPYGGPPGNAPRFAVNHGLNLLRSIQ